MNNTQGIRQPSQQISLYDTLKNSYDIRDNQKSKFKNQGYVYDSDLSNHNEQVYYNPQSKKLLFTIAGTHNLSDVGTDIYGVLGGNLKSTNRYKEAQSILNKAKQRYNPNETTISAHSLGGSIAQYIAGKDDKVLTLDKGATFFQKSRPNEQSFRTSGDVVSLLNANSKNMTTLKNPNVKLTSNPLLYLSPTAHLYDAYNAHNIDNIKNEKIFV
jgi:hypothetical protein